MTNDEKRAIIEAATLGPWYANNHNEILEKLMRVDENGAFVGERPNGIAEIYPLNKQANAEFIVAARTEWPKDLDRLEELGRENAELRQRLERMVKVNFEYYRQIKSLKELLKDLQWDVYGCCQYCARILKMVTQGIAE